MGGKEHNKHAEKKLHTGCRGVSKTVATVAKNRGDTTQKTLHGFVCEHAGWVPLFTPMTTGLAKGCLERVRPFNVTSVNMSDTKCGKDKGSNQPNSFGPPMFRPLYG